MEPKNLSIQQKEREKEIKRLCAEVRFQVQIVENYYM